jgi:hypothetical protein
MPHKIEANVNRMTKWMREGYGVAVYENQNLSYIPDLGKKAFMKVGKDSTFKRAPKRLPDNRQVPIAWAYWLKGVARTPKGLKRMM